MTFEEKEKAFEELVRAHEEEENEDRREELAQKIWDMRSETDLDLLAVYNDKEAEVFRVHVYHDDDDSPDGRSHDCVVCTLLKGIGVTDEFDAGVLWGYWCAKSALASELTNASIMKTAKIYDICGTDLAWKIEATPNEVDWDEDVVPIMNEYQPITWDEVEE